MRAPTGLSVVVLASCVVVLVGCPDADTPVDSPIVDDTLPAIVEGPCLHAGDVAPDFLTDVGCRGDFEVLASDPLDVTLPGARSVKVVLDRADSDALFFQNSTTWPIHHDFVSAHRSGGALPLVPALSSFNTTEYFSPERRFVLGAVTHYEGADLWALELSPYDTASAGLIEKLYRAVAAHAFFGPALVFHPTSENVAVEAAKLPDDVFIRTTDDIFAGIDYQPLSLATSMGRLRFQTAASLADTYLSPEEIVVLDEAPNDITVVQGLITETFQTPLSHINVLSQNRRTPNMGLRGARSDPALRALEGKYIELTVAPSTYTVREVTADEAAAYLDAHRPTPITLPPANVAVEGLVDVEDAIVMPGASGDLRAAIIESVGAFGGKAAQYAVLAHTPSIPTKKAFVIPVSAYLRFMDGHGFSDRVDALLQDEAFNTDAAVRDAALATLRDDMVAAPLDTVLLDAVLSKIASDYGNHAMRFRTSTNSEDLDGFPCAGCYESHSGDPTVAGDVEEAIKETWTTVWLFRTFEERRWYGVDHASVTMALLVHTNYEAEEANGVAVTANPFDASGLDPAFYVNVQIGGSAEVVHPPPGVTSDQFLLYFTQPNQPVAYLSRSSLIGSTRTVLSARQIRALGEALQAVHTAFSPAYGPAAGITGFYGMDVEFKFDDEFSVDGEPELFIKQARPYPGRVE